jgi:putative tricarboxylic transport membrane protein
MFFKKYGDIIVGAVFTAISIALLVAAQMLPKSKVMDIGPEFMPMVIGVITLILALFLLLTSLRNFKAHSEELLSAEIPDCDYKRVISSIILVLIYVFVMKPVGFVISTLVYLMLQMLVLSPDDERDKKHIIILAVIDIIFTILVFMLFRYAFKIVLPAGIFTINI